MRARRALSLFNDVPLRTRRALSLFKWCSVENQKGTIIQMMFRWEPEGHYHYSMMFRWEPEGHYHYSMKFRWEPERHYHYSNDVPLRTRRALSLFKWCSVENQKGTIAIQCLYGDSTLLVLNGSSLNSRNALLALNWRYLACNLTEVQTVTLSCYLTRKEL